MNPASLCALLLWFMSKWRHLLFHFCNMLNLKLPSELTTGVKTHKRDGSRLRHSTTNQEQNVGYTYGLLYCCRCKSVFIHSNDPCQRLAHVSCVRKCPFLQMFSLGYADNPTEPRLSVTAGRGGKQKVSGVKHEPITSLHCCSRTNWAPLGCPAT